MRATVTSPVDRLVEHAGLPAATWLVDPERLVELLGRPVRLSRLRSKPGASVLVSYRDGVEDDHPTAHGWAKLSLSSDKFDSVVRRAARIGAEVTDHTAVLAGQPGNLVSGGIRSDPRLGPEASAVLTMLAGEDLCVASYNPSRHLVLAVPGHQQVLRVGNGRLDRLCAAARAFQEQGVPTLETSPWQGRSAVLASPRWGAGDLTHWQHDPVGELVATDLGRHLAQLHSGAPSEMLGIADARIGPMRPPTRALASLAPAAGRWQRVSGQVAQRLSDLRCGHRVGLVHGDLTPDQVLVEPDPVGAGAPEFRVIDLDRAGVAPVGVDLGSWLASCRVSGVPRLAEALLAGYQEHAGLPPAEVLAAWTARALLMSAPDPMRRGRRDWPDELQRRLRLAEAVLAADNSGDGQW